MLKNLSVSKSVRKKISQFWKHKNLFVALVKSQTKRKSVVVSTHFKIPAQTGSNCQYFSKSAEQINIAKNSHSQLITVTISHLLPCKLYLDLQDTRTFLITIILKDNLCTYASRQSLISKLCWYKDLTYWLSFFKNQTAVYQRYDTK